MKRILIPTILFATNCLAAPAVPEGMKVATEKSVQDCEFKGDVHGVSLFYGVFAKAGYDSARKEAFEQAKEIGANTVVWNQTNSSSSGTSVDGNAYLCP